MKDATIVKTGIVGSVITAICCFTPALVIALGAVGLSAWLGWIDYVLLPTLAVFLAMTAYGLWRRQRAAACCVGETQTTKKSA
ncbi:MAG: mercury resistance system transport protein MerF [Rhodospirillales bacterium]|nr:mercury resistance system transport protein MerF [Rhodospirillales bacterium]